MGGVAPEFVASLTQPAYPIAEAAGMAQTTQATVRRWLQGYDTEGHHMDPVLGGAESGQEYALRPRMVSFLKLAELILAVRFRHGDMKNGPISLQRIRAAHTFARNHFELDYPFALAKFRAQGGHILGEFERTNPGQGHLAFDMGGQWVLPGMVWDQMSHFDYRGDLASAYYPYGKDKVIVLNPLIRGGEPTISGTSVTVDRVIGRKRRGESVEALAMDYHVPPATIDEVIHLAAA